MKLEPLQIARVSVIASFAAWLVAGCGNDDSHPPFISLSPSGSPPPIASPNDAGAGATGGSGGTSAGGSAGASDGGPSGSSGAGGFAGQGLGGFAGAGFGGFGGFFDAGSGVGGFR